MVVTNTTYPVTIDGVRLDSAAKGIDVKTRSTAAARPADVSLPGVDGVSASLEDPLDVMTRIYSMWVLGTDDDGIIPGGSNGMAECLARLDDLTFLFGTRHRLLDVQEVVDAAGTVRQFWGKVVDSISPEVKAGGLGRFQVSIQVPDGVGQDVTATDWTQTAPTSGVFYAVTPLQGSTGPINDGVILVTGPANNPKVIDYTTGAYCQLNVVLAAGTNWRLNSGTWSSRYGAGLTLGSADTTGTDGGPVTVKGGGSNRYLRFRPSLSGGLRKVQLSLTAAGMSGATALSVRARRKFLI